MKNYQIIQVGPGLGDKYLDGNIPNLKIGELRYYPQDNSNLFREKSREISPKTLMRIFRCMFPDYDIELYEPDNSQIDHIVKRGTSDYILNKGYVCIKEATPMSPGTILNFHNGFTLVFYERYQQR